MQRLIEKTTTIDNSVPREYKPLGTGDVCTYRELPKPLCSPSRVIDLVPMTRTNIDLIAKAKDELHAQIIGTTGRRIVDTILNQLGQFRRICSNGRQYIKGTVLTHFDNTALYFDPERNPKPASVKLGPLRAVQSYTTLKLLQLLRRSPQEKRLLHDCPANTDEKIRYLSAQGALHLSAHGVDRLCALHRYFLWCFAISQYAYRRQRTTEVAVPDVDVFRENLAELKDLLTLTGN